MNRIDLILFGFYRDCRLCTVRLFISIYTLLLILLVNDVNGQASLSNVVPPSPEASALAKYGEIPVSYNTGIPLIEVPLYNYTDKGITVPIGLSYHASGIRVNEKSTWVGAGWVVNVSGVISRTVNGIPDELNSNNQVAMIKNYYNGLLPEAVSERSGIANNAPDFRLDAYYSKIYDLEQDTYHYNFLGRSGKIVFDENHIPILLPQEDLLIEFKVPGSPLDGYIITDENGYKYFFDVTERTETVTTITESVITGWFLSRISTPLGEEVYFAYNNVQYDNFYRSQSYQYSPIREGGDSNSNENLTTSLVHSHAFTKQLYQITSKNNLINVTFFANTPREDSSFGDAMDEIGNRLDSIVAKDALGRYIKKIDFNYEYFGTTAEKNKRLKLTSITEGNIGVQPKIHRFTYYENNLLPKLSSFKIDHWGFYNSNNANTVVPRTYYLGTLPRSDNHYVEILPITYTGADRETDADRVKSSMLKSIEYPTKGISEFEYEPNDYDKIFTGSNVLTADKRKYSPDAIFVNPEIRSGEVVVEEASFYVGRYQHITGNFSFYFPSGYENSGANYVSVKIINSLGTALFEATPPQQNGPIDIQLPPGNYKLQVKCTFQLSGFNASAFVNYEREDIVQKKVGGGVRIRKITNVPFEGGAPLSKVFVYEQSPGISSGIMMGNISYMSKMKTIYPFGTGRIISNLSISSAINAQVLTHATNSVMYSTITILEGDHKNTITYYDDFQPVALRPNNGRCVRTLDDCPYDFIDFNMPGSKVPSTVFIASSPLSEISWVKQGTDYLKIKEVIKNYKLNSLPREVMGYQLAPVLKFEREPATNSSEILPPTGWVENFYFYRPFWLSLDKSIEIDYSSQFPGDISKANTKQTRYQYSENHLQPVAISQENGVENIITKLKYPLDYPTVSEVINPIMTGEKAAQGLRFLQEKHIITNVIEKYGYVQNRDSNGVVFEEKVTFGFLTTFMPGKPLVDRIYSLEITVPIPKEVYLETFLNSPSSLAWDARFLEKIVYEKYDDSFNVLQIKKKDDRPTSYLWDYANSFPIAQVNNATYDNVASTSFESDNKGNFSFSGVPEVHSSAPTGKRVYRLNGTNGLSKSNLNSSASYIISYWTNSTLAFPISGTESGYPIAGDAINGWKYFQHKINGQTQVVISGTGLIDEVRLYPVNSEMTTYTYDPGVGVTSVSDANNQTLYYDYDGVGRLISIKGPDRQILKTFEYHYKQD